MTLSGLGDLHQFSLLLLHLFLPLFLFVLGLLLRGHPLDLIALQLLQFSFVIVFLVQLLGLLLFFGRCFDCFPCLFAFRLHR